MSTETTSIREQYTGQKQPPVESEVEDPREPYLAFDSGQQGRRELGLLLFYADGITTEVVYYTYLVRIIGTSQEFLTLMCTDCVYEITGYNLARLLFSLQDHKVRYIQAFNRQKHQEPAANDDAAFVEHITRQLTEDYWEAHRQRHAARAAR